MGDISDDIKSDLRRLKGKSAHFKGGVAEDLSKFQDRVLGYETRETGVGSDYERRKVDWLTGGKGPWDTKVEVKSGSSDLTPRQREEKRKTEKKGKKYVVKRFM